MGYIWPFYNYPILSIVLMVVVGTEGNMMAGEPLTLTCTVSVLEGVSGVPVIAWRRPDGSSVDSDDLVTVGDSETSDQITTRALEFHSLYTSHGGQYTCIATLDVDGSTSTALVTKDVIVQSKFDVQYNSEHSIYKSTYISQWEDYNTNNLFLYSPAFNCEYQPSS